MNRTIEQHRGPLRELAIELRGMLRRVVIAAATSDRLWQFLGYEGIDGERDTFQGVEVFQGVGFASRPRAGRGEAVIGHVGGRAGHPVALATRDRSTEPGDLAEDETQVHTSAVQVRLRKDGVVVVTDRGGGVAVELPTKASVDELRDKVLSHGHVCVSPGGISSKPAVGTATPPVPLVIAPIEAVKKFKSA